MVPIYKQSDETNCSSNRELPLLSATCQTLSDIHLSRLIRYAEEIIGDYQCGF